MDCSLDPFIETWVDIFIYLFLFLAHLLVICKRLNEINKCLITMVTRSV